MLHGRSFQVPSDLDLLAQYSIEPLSFGSPFLDQCHYFVPSGHYARLVGIQPFVTQMLSVTPLSPEVAELLGEDFFENLTALVFIRI